MAVVHNPNPNQTRRKSRLRENYYTPCPFGLSPGLYVVMFYDCPFCKKLLKTDRFKRMIRSLNQAGYVFRVIIYPRQLVGGNIDEHVVNPYDYCIAEYAMWLAQSQLFLNYNDQLNFWRNYNLLSPLILLVPPPPGIPILLPAELSQYLNMYDPKSPEFNEAILFITSYLRGRIYLTTETQRRGRLGIPEELLRILGGGT